MLQLFTFLRVVCVLRDRVVILSQAVACDCYDAVMPNYLHTALLLAQYPTKHVYMCREWSRPRVVFRNCTLYDARFVYLMSAGARAAQPKLVLPRSVHVQLMLTSAVMMSCDVSISKHAHVHPL